jgi:hemolysin activation/secretion protein
MRPRTKKCGRQGFWGRLLVRDAASIVIVLLTLADAKAQEPEPAISESPPEAEIEPTPLPGTEILLEPQLPPSEAPLRKRTLKLVPPGVVEPILPQVNFEALARSGRLWSFHGVVKDFRFVGNHAFSTGELAKVVEKYKGRELTAEDLEQARQDLTLLYINKGYVNSGAVLPDQDGKNGVITFELVEGRLTAINLKGNFWFRPWWLRNEMRRGAGQPLNFNKLKESLQLLRQNPTISRINAELRPGGVPGESILDVDIKDTQPFRFAIEFDNKRPPSVGAEIVQARFTDLNVTGHNDLLEIIYSTTFPALMSFP